jgi:transposase
MNTNITEEVFMKNNIQNYRILAVKRFLNGERPSSICTSLGRSRSWLYKWVNRYVDGDNSWSQSRSCRPINNPARTSLEIEEIVKMIRLDLYNRDLFCGAQAIRWEMEDLNIKPLPSIPTINRILSRNGLTHRRTGNYQPKGKAYPKLPSLMTNQTHQADLVGPCYLKGPVRFYSLNAVDLATARCGISPSMSKSGQSMIDGFWAIWKRMGIPDNVQVDNEMSFYGSRKHPRGMGPLIRLCLHNNVEPWFIPVAGAYRYSKLGGKTPLKALSASGKELRFPDKEKAPSYPMKKPEIGRYHVVRFIRGDMKLNIFGELFKVSPDLQYEYVVATIDVKEQKLKLYLNKSQLDEFIYQLR